VPKIDGTVRRVCVPLRNTRLHYILLLVFLVDADAASVKNYNYAFNAADGLHQLLPSLVQYDGRTKKMFL